LRKANEPIAYRCILAGKFAALLNALHFFYFLATEQKTLKAHSTTMADTTPTHNIIIEIDKREFTPERARTTDHHVLQER